MWKISVQKQKEEEKTYWVAVGVKGGEAGRGLSNQKQAQSAEAEKQCATSSDELHKSQTEPELIQSVLHQCIKQLEGQTNYNFPRREVLFTRWEVKSAFRRCLHPDGLLTSQIVERGPVQELLQWADFQLFSLGSWSESLKTCLFFMIAPAV